MLNQINKTILSIITTILVSCTGVYVSPDVGLGGTIVGNNEEECIKIENFCLTNRGKFNKSVSDSTIIKCDCTWSGLINVPHNPDIPKRRYPRPGPISPPRYR